MFTVFFFFNQRTAYYMRISDWSTNVCSSDLPMRSAGSAYQGSPVGRRNPADAWRPSVPPLKAQNACIRSAIITLVSLSVIACVLELTGLLDRAIAADARPRERGDARGIWLLPSNTTVAVLMRSE